MAFPKPKILVSECMGFAACRYNGQTAGDHVVDLLGPFVEYLPVCPETAIGLGTPRFPVRQVEKKGEIRLVQPESGRDLTDDLNGFAGTFLEGKVLDGAILKYKSPSCGASGAKVYDGTQKHDGQGMFARRVRESFPAIAVEDEGRLKNFRLREHFFTKIFTLARFRAVVEDPAKNALERFQQSHKYLFMAYHQSGQKALGRIVANHEKRSREEQAAAYGKLLGSVLKKAPSKPNMINALQHMGGYFSKTSGEREKAFFRESLELYREGRIPLSSVLLLIQGWALRDENEYILGQVLLRPYPRELTELKDSGRDLSL